jgi:hypothetical protein
MTPQIEAGARVALERALRNGYARLKEGNPALDAVTAAITVVADDPLFNKVDRSGGLRLCGGLERCVLRDRLGQWHPGRGADSDR